MKAKSLFFIALSVTLLAISISAKGQDSVKTKFKQNYKFGIGLGAGFTTGYGISFRYFPKRFGVQANFAPYKDSDTERHSAGITFLFTLIESKKTNLYLYQGNHYFYQSNAKYVLNPKDSTQTIKQGKFVESYINNGLGVGLQIFIGNRVELNIMTGYAAYNNFRKVNLTGEAAIYYKF